jgi:hypothetical protein
MQRVSVHSLALAGHVLPGQASGGPPDVGGNQLMRDEAPLGVGFETGQLRQGRPYETPPSISALPKRLTANMRICPNVGKPSVKCGYTTPHAEGPRNQHGAARCDSFFLKGTHSEDYIFTGIRRPSLGDYALFGYPMLHKNGGEQLRLRGVRRIRNVSASGHDDPRRYPKRIETRRPERDVSIKASEAEENVAWPAFRVDR